MDKKQLRKHLKEIRDQIPEEIQKSAPIECMENLRKTEEYQSAKVIYIFLSYQSEMNTFAMLPMIWEDGKKTAVPRVEGRDMHFYQIESLSDCESGAWGILEPKKICPRVEEAGLMLMPGLGFDKKGGRIGYGGGFYDRYLEKHRNVIRVGLAYEEQIMDNIEIEEHDVPTEYLLTPSVFQHIK